MILALLLASFPAQAEPRCMPRDHLVELLEGRYNEQPVAIGLESGGRLIEVFATLNRRTWTLTMSTPDGVTCVIAAGLEWQDVEPEDEGT